MVHLRKRSDSVVRAMAERIHASLSSVWRLISCFILSQAIHAAVEKLSKKHSLHIANYGTGNEKRLTGKHETASIDTFK